MIKVTVELTDSNAPVKTYYFSEGNVKVNRTIGCMPNYLSDRPMQVFTGGMKLTIEGILAKWESNRRSEMDDDLTKEEWDDETDRRIGLIVRKALAEIVGAVEDRLHQECLDDPEKFPGKAGPEKPKWCKPFGAEDCDEDLAWIPRGHHLKGDKDFLEHHYHIVDQSNKFFVSCADAETRDRVLEFLNA